jgi:phosphonate transport system substrate-binding protein
MKKLKQSRLARFACAVLFCLCTAAAQAAGRTLVFTPLPIEQPETVITASRPLVSYLSKQLGVPITIRYEKNYEDILHLFQEGTIDIVHLGPLPYVTLRQACPEAEPLAGINEADGKTAYTCAMVTAFDGPTALKQVRRSVALTQPLSTCGYLAAGYLLDKHGIQLDALQHDYLGNHDKVALAVVKGTYEVGTIKTTVAKKYTNLTLRVIEETPNLPGFLLVGNKATLSPDQIRKITGFLLKLPDSEKKNLNLGKYGFTAITNTDYDLIRQYSRFFR